MERFLPLCYNRGMSDDADAERALRIEQMTVNIEKMRFDIAETQRQAETRRLEWERSQKWELLKLFVSAVVAAAALLGGGAAIGTYLTRRSEPPATQQPMFPPGTVITIPAAPLVAQPAPVQPK